MRAPLLKINSARITEKSIFAKIEGYKTCIWLHLQLLFLLWRYQFLLHIPYTFSPVGWPALTPLTYSAVHRTKRGPGLLARCYFPFIACVFVLSYGSSKCHECAVQPLSHFLGPEVLPGIDKGGIKSLLSKLDIIGHSYMKACKIQVRKRSFL